MKILITYATAGAGHKKAAEALYHQIRDDEDHQVVFADVLNYTSLFYKHSYSRTYTFLITRVPWAWGFFFKLLDQPWMLGVMTAARRLHNTINAWAFHRYLCQEQFDCIISAHFLPNEVSAYLKRRGKIHSKIISVVTDYDVHRIWLSKGIDHYAVASDWTKDKIVSLGVDESRVSVTGIPTDRKFSAEHNVQEIKERLDIQEGVFTVLIATGSFGIGPIEEIVEKLDGIQTLVICGHNKALYERLSKKQDDLLKIYGFVDNMHELMEVADAMITKPGGLSISEALVTGLPLIFFHAIPGQEENNVKVLATYRVGVSGCSVKEMAAVLKEYQESFDAYRDASYRAQHLGKPNAVQDVLALMG